MAVFYSAANTDNAWIIPDFSYLNTEYNLLAVGFFNNAYHFVCRFPNITIPQGSTILTAKITFKCGEAHSEDNVDALIATELADNAATYSTYANYTGRSWDTGVAWNNIEAWALNSWYDSPDISATIQTIVSRGGWTSGNAISIRVANNGSSNQHTRDAWSYYYNSANAAYLTITYTVGGGATYTLTAAVAAFTLTGINEVLKVSRKLIVSVGSFTLTGINSIISKAYFLVASASSFTLSTVSSNLKVARKLITSVAAFSVSTVGSIITKTYLLIASAVSFTLDTISAILSRYVPSEIIVPKIWGNINGIDIPTPSRLTEKTEPIGDYNMTLEGISKRYIKNVKKSWILGYDCLTSEQYDLIYTEFEKCDPNKFDNIQEYAEFTITDIRMGCLNEHVFMSISPRVLIPGTNNLSSVEITLTQI